VPAPSDWNARSIEVELLEPNSTTQSSVVVALEPGCTIPKLVMPDASGGHPAASTSVALGTIALTTVELEAAVARSIPGVGAATPTASAHAAQAIASAHARARLHGLRPIILCFSTRGAAKVT
jgi:hypothetical protein